MVSYKGLNTNKGSMKISMINIIVSAFVLSVTAGLFYLNRRPAENIDDVTLLTLFKK